MKIRDLETWKELAIAKVKQEWGIEIVDFLNEIGNLDIPSTKKEEKMWSKNSFVVNIENKEAFIVLKYKGRIYKKGFRWFKGVEPEFFRDEEEGWQLKSQFKDFALAAYRLIVKKIRENSKEEK